MRAILILALAIAAAPVALASHPSVSRQVRVNLDHDPAREIVSRETDVSADHTFQRATVSVSDRCGTRWRRHQVVRGTWREERAFALANIDGVTRRAEVFAALATARAEGAAAVVRLDRGGSVCARPRPLFAYSTARSDVAALLAEFDVAVVELERRFRGREIVVRETLMSLPGRTRSTYYRYDAARSRYVRYRQETTID